MIKYIKNFGNMENYIIFNNVNIYIGKSKMLMFIVEIIILIYSIVFYYLLSKYNIKYYYFIYFLIIIVLESSFIWLIFGNPGIKNLDQRILLTEIDYNNASYCKICKIVKTKVTHHCHRCNICTDNFEHHCDWMGKCITKQNYYIFIIFIASIIASYFYIINIISSHIFNVHNIFSINGIYHLLKSLKVIN